MSETEVDDSTAPLIEHLTELRTRIIRSVIAFLVGMIVCFPFAEQILSILAEPMADIMRARGEDAQLFFDAPQDAFFAYVKIAVLFGFALTSPYIGMQMWRFVAPGLYNEERGAFLPFLIASPLLFIAGGAFAYYVVMPLAMNFFLGFGSVIPMLSSILGLGGEVTPEAAETADSGLRIFYFGSIKEYLALDQIHRRLRYLLPASCAADPYGQGRACVRQRSGRSSQIRHGRHSGAGRDCDSTGCHHAGHSVYRGLRPL